MQSTISQDLIKSITDRLTTDNPQITQQDIKRTIYRELLQQGYTFTDISRSLVPTVTNTSTTLHTYPTTSPLYGCTTDDDGYVIDPITLVDTIPEDLLISYISSTGHKVCFNIVTLYEYIRRTGKSLHPITREPIPDEIVTAAMLYSKNNQIKFTIQDKDILVDVFITVGELIIEAIRTISGSLLDNVIQYDVYVNSVSLYTTNLLEPLVRLEPGEITINEFADELIKSDALVSMFAFAKTLRSREVFDSIYTYLGHYLKAVPVLRVPGGVNYTVQPNDRVIDVVLVFYRYLGGYRRIGDIDIVTSNGKSLMLLPLDELVIDELPAQDIYHVNYKDENRKNKVLDEIRDYACNHNNRELLNAIYEDRELDNVTLGDAINSDTWYTITDEDSIRYTVQELKDFVLEHVLLDQMSNKIGELHNNIMTQHNLVDVCLSLLTLGVSTNLKVFENSRILTDTCGGNVWILLKHIDPSIVADEIRTAYLAVCAYGSLVDDRKMRIVQKLIDYDVRVRMPYFDPDLRWFIGSADDVSLFVKFTESNYPYEPFLNDVEIDAVVWSALELGGNKIANYVIDHNPYPYVDTIIKFRKGDQVIRLFDNLTHEQFNKALVRNRSNITKRRVLVALLQNDKLDKSTVNSIAIGIDLPLDNDIRQLYLLHKLFDDHKGLYNWFHTLSDISMSNLLFFCSHIELFGVQQDNLLAELRELCDGRRVRVNLFNFVGNSDNAQTEYAIKLIVNVMTSNYVKSGILKYQLRYVTNAQLLSLKVMIDPLLIDNYDNVMAQLS